MSSKVGESADRGGTWLRAFGWIVGVALLTSCSRSTKTPAVAEQRESVYERSRLPDTLSGTSETATPSHDASVARVDHVVSLAQEKVGLEGLIGGNELGGAPISEILGADDQGLSNKIVVAVGEADFQVGYGAAGLGFRGDGHGVARIMASDQIDTGAVGPKGARRVGKLDIGSGTSKGFCRTSQIAAVVKRRAGAIRACYEQRLQVKSELKGKLTVRWTISLDGEVQGVRSVANTLGDTATTNCVFRHVRRMRFQKPEGGICVVQWPFVFSPE